MIPIKEFARRLHAGLIFDRRVKVLADMITEHIPKGASVLDIGCGSGMIDSLIMKARPDLSLRGIDVLKRPDCMIECSAFDGHTIPFDNSSFDLCMFVDVLHHTQDIAHIIRLLKEAARTSRKYILIKDHLAENALDFMTLKFMDWVGNRAYGVRLPYNYLSEGRWSECYAEAGLREVSRQAQIPLYPPPFSFIFGRKLHFIALLDKGVTDPRDKEVTDPRDKEVTDPGDKKVVSAVALWLIAFGALSVLGVRPFSHAYARPGFGFDYVFMPSGAVDYMEANGIDGRVMNTFHFGQYITFRRYPKNTVFVDGRGYIPAELLEKLDRSLAFNHILNGLTETYNFDSPLVESPDMSFSPASAGFRHPEWALVYWDDNSKLYLKRGPWPGAPWLGAPRWDALIHRDEYLSLSPDEPITPFMKRVRAAGSEARTEIELELLRSVSQTGSARSRIMLGAFYLATDRPAKALESLPVFRPDMPDTTAFAAYVLAGDAYLQSGKPAEGVRFYKKALRLGKDPEIVFKIGGAYMAMDENRKAVRYFNKALKMDDKMIHVYPLLIYAYQSLGMSKEAEETRVKYNEQKRRIGSYELAKALFDEGASAYKEKNYDIAIEKFAGALDISPSNPDIHSNMAYVYYDTGRTSEAEGHFRRALELNPRHANANYGIALVYVKLGDNKTALRYLKRYLEIEPAGYFSRTARERIAELSR